MTLDALIMLAGAFVAVVPLLGFPSSWDTVLMCIAGCIIIALGITVRRRGLRPPRAREVHVRNGSSYAESIPVHEETDGGVHEA